jgi:hypothetical protein
MPRNYIIGQRVDKIAEHVSTNKSTNTLPISAVLLPLLSPIHHFLNLPSPSL